MGGERRLRPARSGPWGAKPRWGARVRRERAGRGLAAILSRACPALVPISSRFSPDLVRNESMTASADNQGCGPNLLREKIFSGRNLPPIFSRSSPDLLPILSRKFSDPKPERRRMKGQVSKKTVIKKLIQKKYKKMGRSSIFQGTAKNI